MIMSDAAIDEARAERRLAGRPSAPTEGRRSGKGAATRDAILARAMDLASVNGLEGISIGTLARETGLSKSGLFAHFGSKQKLQIEILEATAERFIEAVVRPARRERAGEPRLRRILENWLQWDGDGRLQGGCVFIAAAAELDDRPGPVRDHLVWQQKEWMAVLARAADRAKQVGDFRSDLDVRQFAHDLYAIALGYHYAARLLRDPEARTRALTAFERLVADSR